MFWKIIRLPTEAIILSVINEGVESVMASHGLPLKKGQSRKRLEFSRDRRKRRFDRRKSVRDGVVVSLSYLNLKNRRRSRDRRKVT